MAKMFDLLKSAAGQVGLFTPIGNFHQSVAKDLDRIISLGLDQPAQWIIAKRSGTGQTVGANEDIILNFAPLSSGIDYDTETGEFELTAGKIYHLQAHGRFASFSDPADGVVVVEWVLDPSEVPLPGGVPGAFRPTTHALAATNDHPIVEAIYRVPTDSTFGQRVVKLRSNAITFGTASAAPNEWMATIIEIR